MKEQCLLCKGTRLVKTLTIKNAPSSVSKPLPKHHLIRDKKITLTLLTCADCQLSQLSKADVLKPPFYEDYQMAVSYSSQMYQYENGLARDFIDFFGLKNKNAFEIGCGDGLFSSLLNKHGLRMTGVEPSKAFCKIARKKINVINCYFNKTSPLKRRAFDAFVSRQVFEHLRDPNQVLIDAKLFLKPDGVGLIEVPSFLTALEDNRYYDIFIDHPAYYTKYTLSYLLTKNNFEVIKIVHTANKEYLTAYFRNNDYHRTRLITFSNNFHRYIVAFKKMLYRFRKKKIVVWGAGGKGTALMSIAGVNTKDIVCVVDSDPYKCGKFTPGSHMLIRSPQEVDFSEIDLVIISAEMYRSEILKILKNKFHYRNKIAILVPIPHIFNI